MFNNYHYVSQILEIMCFDLPPKTVTRKGRNFHSLTFRVSGDTAFYVNGKEHVSKTNDVTFMPINTTYNLSNGQWNKIICVHFRTCDEITEYQSFTPRVPEIYKNDFEKLLEIWNKKERGYKYAALSLLNTILENIYCEILDQNSKEHLSRTKQILAPAIEYIKNNLLSENLNVDVLAKQCFISETYFRILFKKHYGTSPVKYVINQRLNYAVSMLKSGYFSVEQVAEKCGFSDAKYFSTCFKKHYGAPPSSLINK